MTEVTSLASLLAAMPLADPAAAPSVLPRGDGDPFAGLLALLAAAAPPPSPATPSATVAAPSAALPLADLPSPTAGDDGAAAADQTSTKDKTDEDVLAASVSAMLAIAPAAPAPTPVAALPAPPAEPAAPGPVPCGLATAASARAPVAPTAIPVHSDEPLPVAPLTHDVDPIVTASSDIAEAPDRPTAPPKPPVPAVAAAPDQGREPDPSPPSRAAGPAAPPSPTEPTLPSGPPAVPQATPDPDIAARALPPAILKMLRESSTIATRPASAANGSAATPDVPKPGAAPVVTPARDVQPVRRDVQTSAPRAAAIRTPRTAPIADKATDLVALPLADTRPPVAALDAAPLPAGTPADPLVQGTLAIARDGQWLDTLARDIATSASGRDLHFKLDPETLGSLTVSIVAHADGTAIRLTADSDRAHAILSDAQPRLIAEARAQGLRVSEAHVELDTDRSGNGSAGGSWGQAGGQPQPQSDRRQQTSSPNHLPFARRLSDEASEAPAAQPSERYA